MYHDKDKLKQTIFILALFGLGGFLFYLLNGFLSAFLGAVVLYILLRRPFYYLTEIRKKKWNKYLAIAMLMWISFIALVIPVLVVSLMLAGKITYVINHYADIAQLAQDWSAKAKEYFEVDILSKDSISHITSYAAQILPKFLSAAVKVAVDIFVSYFVLYFMLANSRYIEIQTRRYLPFKESNNRLLLTELKKQTISNSIGIVVLAVIQGVVSYIGYLIAGIDQPGLWAVITGIASALPVVGTSIVWIPICIFSYVKGSPGHAIFLAIYSAVVLGIVEHVFRILVLKKFGDTHPLITLFGVVIGIDLFGFIGLIFGPLLISYFILLLRIYRNEYLEAEINN